MGCCKGNGFCSKYDCMAPNNTDWNEHASDKSIRAELDESIIRAGLGGNANPHKCLKCRGLGRACLDEPA